MFEITVVYSVDAEPYTQETPIKVADLRRNEDLRHSLGFGDNVNFLLNGVALPDEAIIPNGSTVTVETAANKKALALAV